jgi:hypothetical protein
MLYICERITGGRESRPKKTLELNEEEFRDNIECAKKGDSQNIDLKKAY